MKAARNDARNFMNGLFPNKHFFDTSPKQYDSRTEFYVQFSTPLSFIHIPAKVYCWLKEFTHIVSHIHYFAFILSYFVRYSFHCFFFYSWCDVYKKKYCGKLVLRIIIIYFKSEFLFLDSNKDAIYKCFQLKECFQLER